MLFGCRGLHFLNGFDLHKGYFNPFLAYLEPKEILKANPECALVWIQIQVVQPH